MICLQPNGLGGTHSSGWVDVDALHLAAQALALGQAGHHLQGVA